ncbi:hypothetical protein HJFPF1_07463 [Paramyrothecium foliicola]|nr:hypothetical protein HJFPF1_07463 [Paramyrothecium foliicola]
MALQPLPDDAESGSGTIQSQITMLHLPTEILAIIIHTLAHDKPSLAALAQVNKDCRELARRCQFAEIYLGLNYPAQHLILQLAADAEEERMSSVNKRSIGFYIRKITYGDTPASRAVGVSQELHPNALVSSNRLREAFAAKEEMMDAYRVLHSRNMQLTKILLFNITNALPSLTTLVWADSMTLNRNFFETLSKSSIRHLSLPKARIDDPWEWQHSLDAKLWPLQSLCLHVYFDEGENAASSASRRLDRATPMAVFFDALFRLCGPSLEILGLKYNYCGYNPKIASFGGDQVSFPKLKFLQVKETFLTSSTLKLLLSSPLQHIEIPIPPDHEKLYESGQLHGTLKDLKALIVNRLPSTHEACLNLSRFIERHKNIEKLLVHERCTVTMGTAQLNYTIMPVLEKCQFLNLRCLSLNWAREQQWLDEDSYMKVSDAAIATIGMITSLERLRFCVGRPSEWLVDHEALRIHLKPLSRLRMLVIVHDTYVADRFNSAAYYPTPDATRGCSDEDPIVQAVKEWEKNHLTRMISQVEQYATVLTALEKIYCGQRDMAVKRGAVSLSEVEVVNSFKNRRREEHVLRSMFGIKSLVDLEA